MLTVTLRPPSVIHQPPSVTLRRRRSSTSRRRLPQPPSVTIQPPSVTLQPGTVHNPIPRGGKKEIWILTDVLFTTQTFHRPPFHIWTWQRTSPAQTASVSNCQSQPKPSKPLLAPDSDAVVPSGDAMRPSEQRSVGGHKMVEKPGLSPQNAPPHERLQRRGGLKQASAKGHQCGADRTSF